MAAVGAGKRVVAENVDPVRMDGVEALEERSGIAADSRVARVGDEHNVTFFQMAALRRERSREPRCDGDDPVTLLEGWLHARAGDYHPPEGETELPGNHERQGRVWVPSNPIRIKERPYGFVRPPAYFCRLAAFARCS